jgi:hypothetical protein
MVETIRLMNGEHMKKIILGLALLNSLSAFAEVTCKTIVNEQITYTCEFGHYVSLGNGMRAGISGCIMQFDLSPASETRAEIEKGSVRVTQTIQGNLFFSERILAENGKIDGQVSIPNGATIQCSGVNELKF